MSLGVDVLLDDAGDLAFEDQDFPMGVSFPQAVNIELKTIKGEWFLDTDRGIDYFNFIFVKEPILPLVRSMFRAKIVSVPGCGELERFSMQFNKITRRLTVGWATTQDASELVLDVGTPL
jgi:hypothetical protein